MVMEEQLPAWSYDAAGMVPWWSHLSTSKNSVVRFIPVDDSAWMLGCTSLMIIAAMFFAAGCCMGLFPRCARSIARRLLRMLLASLTHPDGAVVPGVGPLRRTIGVQSQVHYTWHDSEPRFKAANQGFQRSGEVTIEQ